MDENFKDFDDVYILKSKLLAILKEAREKMLKLADDERNLTVDKYEDLAILDKIILKYK